MGQRSRADILVFRLVLGVSTRRSKRLTLVQHSLSLHELLPICYLNCMVQPATVLGQSNVHFSLSLIVANICKVAESLSHSQSICH